MSTPSLPPRPARSQNPPSASSTSMDAPKIPPRPNRGVERSVSPNRDAFARSPLNDPAFIAGRSRNALNTNHSSLSAPDLLNRPPSVNLPSIGQEGSEYATFNEPGNDEATQTKNVAGDLPLHAPKPSMAASAAKSRIAPLTRTDSSQAAAAGVGKARIELEDKSPHKSARSNSSGGTRPQSVVKDDSEKEQGIPEIGLQVPMFPNAGDVQMPTPTPSAQGHKPGIGFYNDGSQPSSRHHVRTKSGNFGPPGSYGLHGHGVIANDPFEKAWYEKHPEALAKESQGEYGPAISEDRKEWMLSSEELNKLVHSRKDVGFGTSPNVIGTPDEQIGYIASEEYASRMATPATAGHAVKRRTSSQAHADSPLRQASFPVAVMDPVVRVTSNRSANDQAVEDDDTIDTDTIHVDPPSRRHSKIGGGGYDPPVEDLGPHGGNSEERGGWIDEKGYGVPILASDEVAKHPEDAILLPAVDVEQQRRGDTYYAGYDSEAPPMYQSGRRQSGKSSSRPTSLHGASLGLQRFASHEDREGTGTPLEDVREYEPLFPDDDDEKKKPTTATDKLKRPDVLAKHHFPSQDIWEDTPNSLQLQTTVGTPQMPEDGERTAESEAPPSRVFEPPEKENARMRTLEPEDKINFIPEHTKQFAKTNFSRDVLNDMPTRPGLKQRFPSQDIWEDTPDYTHLTTTVASPQIDEITSPVDVTSPTDFKATDMPPEVPPRPTKAAHDEGDAQPPSVPARPPQRLRQVQNAETSPTERKPPSLPDRPKPQVPPRPAKPASQEAFEDAPLERTTSVGSTGSDAAAAKSKPAVPSRPTGGKIAALKAGFMNDLNTRLQLGPQAPKPQEPIVEPEAEEQEKAPLSDARKGRARGPARRKPAASPSGTSEDATAGRTAKFEIAQPWTVWSVSDEDGAITLPGAASAKPSQKSTSDAPGEHFSSALPAKSDTADSEEAHQPNEPSTLYKLASSAAAVLGLSSLAPEPSSSSSSSAAPAPAPHQPVEEEADSHEKTTSMATDVATQTGQQDMEIQTGSDGTSEKFTAYLGGRAPDEGSVVVDQQGVEHVGDLDGQHKVMKTGHGM